MTVIAPSLVPEIIALDVVLKRRRYCPGDVAGHRLVIAATGDPEVNHLVFCDAESAGILCNSADDRHACSFMLPSVVRHDPVTVAVSTAGASPALSVWLRHLLAGFVGPEHAEMAMILGEARRALHRSGRSSEQVDWRSLLDGDLPSLVREGRLTEAREMVSRVAEVTLQS